MIATSIPSLALSAAILVAGVFNQQAKAAISVNNLHITTDSVSFDIIGTIPNVEPLGDRTVFFFVNPDSMSDPGFALGTFAPSTKIVFTGLWDIAQVDTGNPVYGDYFYLLFPNGVSPGDDISGKLTATWDDTAFDPFSVGNLDVYWGYDGFSITGGTYLGTTSSVPEPSAAALFAGFVVIGCASLRRNQ